MKKLSGLLALITAFSLLTAQSVGAGQTDSVREVRERGEGLSHAFGSHDLTGIRSAVADTILMGTGKGRHKRVSREEYIRGISRMFSAAADFQLARTIEQIGVRGPVASVLVSQVMTGTDVNGETHRIGDRLLQTWKKTSNGWLLVGESEIPARRGRATKKAR
jgi:ketosteroid isomerase-like protein